MQKERVILIGCSDTLNIPGILDSIKETPPFRYRLITLSREPDLPMLIRSLSPQLLILNFRNNKTVFSSVQGLIKEQNLPVICIKTPYGEEGPEQYADGVCINFPPELIQYRDHFSSIVNSIFKLAELPVAEEKPRPLAPVIHPGGRQEHGDLSRYVMELDQKNEVLQKVKERIAELYPRVEDQVRTKLTSIVNSIKMTANDTRLWDDFKLYFERDNPSFLLRLAGKHPELTPKDLKYCCYLTMNMSNNDIHSVLGINQESVRTHKYRLKKKLALKKKQDLLVYLRGLSEQCFA